LNASERKPTAGASRISSRAPASDTITAIASKKIEGAPASCWFADAEGVVEQVEHAGDVVPDKGLRAKADRHPDDARTGDQRADLDPQLRQRHHRGDRNDYNKQHIAENRQ
jgi:hypothetical protein